MEGNTCIKTFNVLESKWGFMLLLQIQLKQSSNYMWIFDIRQIFLACLIKQTLICNRQSLLNKSISDQRHGSEAQNFCNRPSSKCFQTFMMSVFAALIRKISTTCIPRPRRYSTHLTTTFGSLWANTYIHTYIHTYTHIYIYEFVNIAVSYMQVASIHVMSGLSILVWCVV